MLNSQWKNAAGQGNDCQKRYSGVGVPGISGNLRIYAVALWGIVFFLQKVKNKYGHLTQSKKWRINQSQIGTL